MQSHPWREIRLDVYESHMNDRTVGQLHALREITGAQLRDHPARRVGILGIAGGNGLGEVDANRVDAVHGYDINPTYLAACRDRYGAVFGGRLQLHECAVDRTLVLEPTDLLIANLIVEYVGIDEFVAFAVANIAAIGVLSCVTQQNHGAGVVSSTAHSDAFSGLESISTEIDSPELAAAMVAAGFTVLGGAEHPLPNGKVLVRQDFAPLG